MRRSKRVAGVTALLVALWLVAVVVARIWAGASEKKRAASLMDRVRRSSPSEFLANHTYICFGVKATYPQEVVVYNSTTAHGHNGFFGPNDCLESFSKGDNRRLDDTTVCTGGRVPTDITPWCQYRVQSKCETTDYATRRYHRLCIKIGDLHIHCSGGGISLYGSQDLSHTHDMRPNTAFRAGANCYRHMVLHPWAEPRIRLNPVSIQIVSPYLATESFSTYWTGHGLDHQTNDLTCVRPTQFACEIPEAYQNVPLDIYFK